MKSRYFLVVVLVPFGVAHRALADDIHVPVDQPTIQAAIDVSNPGDQVIVAPGTYHEVIDLLGRAITLRSSGGPADTTIDGTGLGDSVVTCVRGETPTTVIEGFTLTGGTGRLNTETGWTSGGGMYIDQSNPTLRRLEFVENTAWEGGGLYASISHSHVVDCTFARNHALRSGGAIMDKTSILFTERCVFIGNTAVNNGGAVYYSGSSSVARGCTFLRNERDAGGAVFGITLVDADGLINPASPTILSCLFLANQATGSGGALFSSGEHSHPVVRNSSFVGNRGGAIGTAIYVQVSDIVVHDSIFWWNGDSPTATLGLWFPPCALYLAQVPQRLENKIFFSASRPRLVVCESRFGLAFWLDSDVVKNSVT